MRMLITFLALAGMLFAGRLDGGLEADGGQTTQDGSGAGDEEAAEADLRS